MGALKNQTVITRSKTTGKNNSNNNNNNNSNNNNNNNNNDKNINNNSYNNNTNNKNNKIGQKESDPYPLAYVATFLRLKTTKFLDTSLHLYKRVCPSVGRSVGPLVRPSVRRSVHMSRFCKKFLKLTILCAEMIKKAYKVMINIKTALAYLPPKVAIAKLR